MKMAVEFFLKKRKKKEEKKTGGRKLNLSLRGKSRLALCHLVQRYCSENALSGHSQPPSRPITDEREILLKSLGRLSHHQDGPRARFNQIIISGMVGGASRIHVRANGET